MDEAVKSCGGGRLLPDGAGEMNTKAGVFYEAKKPLMPQPIFPEGGLAFEGITVE